MCFMVQQDDKLQESKILIAGILIGDSEGDENFKNLHLNI